MRTTSLPFATIAILATLAIQLGIRPARSQTEQTAPAQKTDPSNSAKSTNLLANPGVETGAGTAPDGWQIGRPVAGVTCTWDATVGYESTHSLCLTKTENRYFPIAEWRQVVSIKDGTKHLIVSAYVRAKDLGKAVLDVQFLGADGRIFGHLWASYIGPLKAGDPPLSQTWKRYSGTVEIPVGTAQIAIAPQIYGPGTIWFDDLSAVAAP